MGEAPVAEVHRPVWRQRQLELSFGGPEAALAKSVMQKPWWEPEVRGSWRRSSRSGSRGAMEADPETGRFYRGGKITFDPERFGAGVEAAREAGLLTARGMRSCWRRCRSGTDGARTEGAGGEGGGESRMKRCSTGWAAEVRRRRGCAGCESWPG
jgi:hypothetical protein